MKAKFATKRIVLLVLAAVMLATAVVGGTLAYLWHNPTPITNTFTLGNIVITLSESAGEANNYKFSINPNQTVKKDPVITVKEDSFASYVFVKIEESEELDTYIEYEVITENNKGTSTNVEMSNGSTHAGTGTVNYFWTQLKDNSGADVEGVYYMEVDYVYNTDDNTNQDKQFYILKDNCVKTKAYSDPPKSTWTTGSDNYQYPTLTFTAYAIQKSGFYNSQDTTVLANPAFAAWGALQTEINSN